MAPVPESRGRRVSDCSHRFQYSARHEWERWAYASYLLGVEKKNGVCTTRLGVPMFTIRDGRRFAAVDSMYYWRLGEPAETHADLAQYRTGNGHTPRRARDEPRDGRAERPHPAPGGKRMRRCRGHGVCASIGFPDSRT
jgi:hypothetical protein